METMCLKTGIVPSISIAGSLDTRASPSQVSAVGRSSVEKPSRNSLFSRFSFRYPLESLWPGQRSSRNGNRTFNGLSLDDAVMAENGETESVKDEEEDGSVNGGEGRRENWVLKILHVKSVWKGERGNEREGTENDENNGGGDEACDSCAVENDDGEKEDFEFDRGSFSKMLRRVSLAEARLYAQMSHLGSLAYSIPNIKVTSFSLVQISDLSFDYLFCICDFLLLFF